MPRALIRRARLLAGLTFLFALLTLPSCSRSVRSVESASAHSGQSSSPLSSQTEGTAQADVPRPPRTHRPPAYDAIQRMRLLNGPELCAARRPDLARSFVSLELGGNLPPEEVLLLREWIRSAWLQELRSEPVSFQPPACEFHFLCLSGLPARADFLVGALLRALSAPSPSAFYQARQTALQNIKEWDQNSAGWKLNTAARALRVHSTGTAQLKHLQKVDNRALLSLVDQHSGSAKASSLPLTTIENHLSLALRLSTVTVASPFLGEGDPTHLQDEWKEKAGNAATAPATAPAAAPDSPVLIEKDAPELTQGLLAWEFHAPVRARAIETALSLLGLRSVGRVGEAARVHVQPAGGLYSFPALRVDGPHEHVLSTIAELTEQYDRLISSYGAPSEKEWEDAELRSPAHTHFEPRCSGAGRGREVQGAMKLGREALRSAGAPTIVLWGTDTPPEPSE